MCSYFEDRGLLQKEEDSVGDRNQLKARNQGWSLSLWSGCDSYDDESGRNLLLWIHGDGYVFVQKGFEGGRAWSMKGVML